MTCLCQPCIHIQYTALFQENSKNRNRHTAMFSKERSHTAAALQSSYATVFFGSLIIYSAKLFVHNKAVGKTHLEHKTNVTGHIWASILYNHHDATMASNDLKSLFKCKYVYISQLERLAAELRPGAFLPCVSNSLSSTMACGTLMGSSQGAGDTTFPCYE